MAAYSSQAEKDVLIIKHLHIVEIIAKKIAMTLPPGIDIRDLEGAGTIGLLEAIERFDPSKGVQLNTYASFRIRGAILDELRSLDHVTRSMRDKINNLNAAKKKIIDEKGCVDEDELAKALGISMEELFKAEEFAGMQAPISLDYSCNSKNHEDIEEGMYAAIEDTNSKSLEEASSNEDLLNRVSEAISKLPLKQRMIISLYHFDELSLKEIADKLGITESRTCQIYKTAVERIRMDLKAVM